MTGVLSLVAEVEAEPFRPAAGVVLLRPAAEEEAHLQIREAAEVHLDRSVAGGHQDSRHKVREQRPCFCVLVRVREAPAVLPAGVAPHLQPVRQGQQPRSQRTSDRSAERSSLGLRIVH
jgi:hypothetical protein